jgi:zinc transport system ATP-binding protein
MTEPVIEIQKANFSYFDEPVLIDVNLRVESGSFTCIVGPNGGGKTTLLQLILGQTVPDFGKVKVFGKDPSKVRHQIGYMPQQSELDSMFPISVKDVVLTGRLGKHKWWGRYSKTDHQIAAASLSQVGLSFSRTKSFFELSGGQRQRVLIARALASDPELLILDEPTANLDANAERDLFDLLNTLNEKLTIVIVSHDLSLVSSYVKSVVCVNKKVAVHPTGKIPQEMSGEALGAHLRMIKHDQHCEIGEEE